MYTILLVIHTILVLFLIVMVLIQRTSGDGLSGLGGGGGGNQFLTGRGQASFLTRTTAILAGCFFATSLTLAIMASRMTESSIIDTAVPVEETMPVVPLEKTNLAPKKETHKPAPAAPAVPKPE